MCTKAKKIKFFLFFTNVTYTYTKTKTADSCLLKRKYHCSFPWIINLTIYDFKKYYQSYATVVSHNIQHTSHRIMFSSLQNETKRDSGSKLQTVTKNCKLHSVTITSLGLTIWDIIFTLCISTIYFHFSNVCVRAISQFSHDTLHTNNAPNSPNLPNFNHFSTANKWHS